MSIVKQSNWAHGANNVSGRAQLPVDKYGTHSVREAVNVDVMTGGEFRGRIGYELMAADPAPRGLMSFNEIIVYAASTPSSALVKIDTRDGSSDVLAAISPYGDVLGVEHGGELFINASGELYRYDGIIFREWGMPEVSAFVSASPDYSIGSVMPGVYQFAVTHSNAYGEESGTVNVRQIKMTDEGSIDFSNIPSAPAGGESLLYVSSANCSELYLAARTQGGSVSIHSVDTSGQTLRTQYMRRPPYTASVMESHNGVILIAESKVLWITVPMRPDLIDRATGFLQFEEQITNVLSVDGGVYVTTTENTYFITGIETVEVSRRLLHKVGGVKGSGTKVNTSAVWMTEYGQAVGDQGGEVAFPNKGAYAPIISDSGCAGIVRHNGSETVVTTMNRPAEDNKLAACDFYDAEIILTAQPPIQGVSVSGSFLGEIV